MTKTIGYTRLKWEGIECIAWKSYPIWWECFLNSKMFHAMFLQSGSHRSSRASF